MSCATGRCSFFAAFFVVVLVVVVVPGTACSVLVSTSGLTGGASGDDGSADAAGSLPELEAGLSLGDAISASADTGPHANADGSAIDGTSDASNAGSPSDGSATSDASTVAVDAGAGEAGSPDAGHDAGTVSAPDGGCSQDLSNIGAGDFSVSFSLRTTQAGLVALLNQRTACSPSTFWDVRLSSGEIQVETDDGASYVQLTSTGPELDDGALHVLLVDRIGGTVTIYVDGVASGNASSSSSLGALPPLATGTDVCDGQHGTYAFYGTGEITSLSDSSP